MSFTSETDSLPPSPSSFGYVDEDFIAYLNYAFGNPDFELLDTLGEPNATSLPLTLQYGFKTADQTERVQHGTPESSAVTLTGDELPKFAPSEDAEAQVGRPSGLWARLWKRRAPVPEHREVSREQGAGILSKLIFTWISPLMLTGARRTLQLNDIWTLPPDRSVKHLLPHFEASFNARRTKGGKFPLCGAIIEVCWSEFWKGGLAYLLAYTFLIAAPFSLRFLIDYLVDSLVAKLEHTTEPRLARGIGILAGILVMQLLQSLCINFAMYRSMLVGGKARALLIASIYNKSLTISPQAKVGAIAENPPVTNTATTSDESPAEQKSKPKKLQKPRKVKKTKQTKNTESGWSDSRILTLASVDTHHVDYALANWHGIWVSVYGLFFALALLIVDLGYSTLVGYGLIIISFPLMGKCLGFLYGLQARINVISDQRSSLTFEVFQGIRFVKTFGWEDAFIERIENIRKHEIQKIAKYFAARNALAIINICMPTFAAMLSVITYALTDHKLGSARIFSAMAVFNTLKLPMTVMPTALATSGTGWASLLRIQSFLLSEDIASVGEPSSHPEDREKSAEEADDPEFSETASENTIDMNGIALRVESAAFTWEQNMNGEKSSDGSQDHSTKADGKFESASTVVSPPTPFKLAPTSLTFRRGELVAVIGSVGSGKTSLLEALTGEMRRTSGTLDWKISKTYSPQQPWIQNASLRNNILFGKPMQLSWYRQVVHACALLKDFDELPSRDFTEIGERGITLSGGQKARVNLARAIYADPECILMDSVLSAVDAGVGEHIFKHAIQGLLEGKLRILVTHKLDTIHRCDKIVWLENGHVRAVDTYENLLSTNKDFLKMLTAAMVEHKTNENEETDILRTQSSGTSPTEAETDVKADSVIAAEHQATKKVPLKVYVDYLRSSGSLLYGLLAVVLIAIAQASNVGTSLWLSWWISNKFKLTFAQNVSIYAGLGVGNCVFGYIYFVAISMISITSSKVMFGRSLKRVLHAKMSYFDTTPLGRITGIFSKDVDIMDYGLSDAIRMFLMLGLLFISTCALTIYYFHWFGLALGPMMILFLGVGMYYRQSSRELKRFDATLQSHVYARISESLSGASCIRAYGVQDQFKESIMTAIDNMDSAYFLTFADQRWFSVRLEMIANGLLLVIGILTITDRHSIQPATSALILSFMLGIASMLQWLVTLFVGVTNAMNSTERLHHCGTATDQEENSLTLVEPDLAPSWPESGSIQFHDVSLRYRPGLPLVLEHFNLQIHGGERVGFVGRTGAGKSTLLNAIFRLTALDGGMIIIDNKNIADLPLRELRSRLAIIPQDPTLFRGTIRSNLDPFQMHTDLELWSALRKAKLHVDTTEVVDGSSDAASSSFSSSITELNEAGGLNAPSSDSLSTSRAFVTHLDDSVEAEGRNFSAGQRQLLALARALVRNAQIIVCDEVTSSVDHETDFAIQKTMQTAFSGKTVLCIAHRLRTVLEYDRICVMDHGKIVEIDSPKRLFMTQNGVFRKMCLQDNISLEDFERSTVPLDGGKI